MHLNLPGIELYGRIQLGVQLKCFLINLSISLFLIYSMRDPGVADGKQEMVA